MLPPIIPIFPLPNVVLFPNVFLPLHIFEPRYRDMVGDALRGDRIIGMVLLRPGHELEYEGRPPIYPVGCAGVVTHADRLPDGRYNIVLRGLEKFRVTSEDDSRTYRLAHAETLIETIDEQERRHIRTQRKRLELLLASTEESGIDRRLPDSIPDEDLVNVLAQYLQFEPVEKQALLERSGLSARCASLIELLEMKLLTARHSWGSGAH
jgi:uncharacterized protein